MWSRPSTQKQQRTSTAEIDATPNAPTCPLASEQARQKWSLLAPSSWRILWSEWLTEKVIATSSKTTRTPLTADFGSWLALQSVRPDCTMTPAIKHTHPFGASRICARKPQRPVLLGAAAGCPFQDSSSESSRATKAKLGSLSRKGIPARCATARKYSSTRFL